MEHHLQMYLPIWFNYFYGLFQYFQGTCKLNIRNFVIVVVVVEDDDDNDCMQVQLDMIGVGCPDYNLISTSSSSFHLSAIQQTFAFSDRTQPSNIYFSPQFQHKLFRLQVCSKRLTDQDMLMLLRVNPSTVVRSCNNLQKKLKLTSKLAFWCVFFSFAVDRAHEGKCLSLNSSV